MPERPWWRRWDGLPWENEADADARTSFLRWMVTTDLAWLVVSLVLGIFGVAAFLVARRAWLASAFWAAIGTVLAFGVYILWRRLREGGD